jgi:STE24 endopeptidase
VRDPLLGAAAAIVAVVTPVILRYVWVTRPLAAGALRDRLERLTQKLRIRCRDILVWETDGMVVNAAVVGVVPPLRYVLLSDALLERMDEARIEAVFGHESGHVKRHHITYILLFSLISGCLLTVFSQRTHGLNPTLFQWLIAAAGVLLLLKWGLLFTWISWQFERQADIFGARALTLSGLPCDAPCQVHRPESISTGADTVNGVECAGLHTPPALAMNMLPDVRIRARPSSAADPICFTAASVFADTLHDVAKLNGVSPDAGSWRHPSISARSRSLQKLALDPAAAARFERRVTLIKVSILLAAALSALWAVYELRLWTLLGVHDR